MTQPPRIGLREESSSPCFVVVLNDYCYVNGGASRLAIGEAVILAESGVRVIFLGAIGPVCPTLQNAPLDVICLDQLELMDVAKNPSVALQGLWNLAAYRRTKKLLREMDPSRTIVHLHSFCKALSSSPVRAASEMGFRVVCTLHDFFIACPNGVFFDYNERKPCLRRALSMDCITTNCDRRHYAHKLYRVARSAVQRGPGTLPAGVMDYITQSRRSEAIIAPYLPKGARCHPLPPLIEVPHAPPVDVASNSTLVAVGRLDPGKGIEVLIEAAKRTKMRVTLIGDGDWQLRAEAEAVEGCRVTGWLTPQQVLEELSHARCLVFPSLWYETYGLVVDEATARGIPCIVSDISAASERVEDGKTGWVMRAGDVEDLMRCLNLTSDNDTLRAVSIAAYNHFWARHPTRANHAVVLMKTYAAILANCLASGSHLMADQRPKERNMKIAINAGILDDRLSGLGVYTTNVTSSLARLKDVDISIYTAKPEALSVINGASVHLIPSIVQPKYGKVAGLARFIWNQIVFPFLVAKRDLIYCTTHHGILWGYARQVITVHDLLPVKFPDQYRLQTAYYRYLLPILIKRAAAVITISENTKRDLYEQYGLDREKVHVVYNGLDHGRFFVPAADVVARFKKKYSLGNYLLIVGASFPHKNVGAALRAFHQAQTRLPNTELVITGGRKEYTDELKWVVKALDVKRVKFLEYVPSVELPALYAGATALVYPSLYEGFGFPPLEAMACGCPVIVSNTSSLPEVCGGAVYYVDPKNNEEMANVMVALVSDIGLQMQLKERGLLRAKSFSWDTTALGIYDILTKVAGVVKT